MNSQNVTVDPLALASPVNDPEVAEVIDLETGGIISTREFIRNRTYGEAVFERVRIRERFRQGDPTHKCAICGIPAYLANSEKKNFFFRHKSGERVCKQTRKRLTEKQIRARKYHGLRESEAHKRIKRLIEQSLRADPTFVPESIQSEARWKAFDSVSWRQPDVQASSNKGRFAFEVQLSTTFLDVVVDRRLFYRDEGAALVWILGSFDPEYRKMTTDDLLFCNNRNVFVVDDETVRLSEERNHFHLRCHYRRPYLDGGHIREAWEEVIVRFGDLHADIARQAIYYYDYETECGQLRDVSATLLQEEFINCWHEFIDLALTSTQDNLARWGAIRRKFADVRAALPEEPASDASFRNLINAVLSALNGEPRGWRFEKLVEVAHLTVAKHPENLLAFGYALKQGGFESLLDEQDSSGRWGKKKNSIKARIRSGDPEFLPKLKWLPALSVIFPEIGAQVSSYVKRHQIDDEQAR